MRNIPHRLRYLATLFREAWNLQEVEPCWGWGGGMGTALAVHSASHFWLRCELSASCPYCHVCRWLPCLHTSGTLNQAYSSFCKSFLVTVFYHSTRKENTTDG